MKEILLIYAERILQVLVGFAVTYLLINNFTPDNYGLYKYVISISSVLTIVILLGFNVANIRFIPEYIMDKKYEVINSQILIFSIVNLAFLSFIYVVVVLGKKTGAIQWDKPFEIELIFLLSLFYYLKSYLGESLFVAFSKRVSLTSVRLVCNCIQLSMVYYAIVISNVNIHEFFVYILVFAGIEAFLLALGVFSFYFKLVPSRKVNQFGGREVYRYAINNYGFSLVGFLRDSAFSIIIVSYVFRYQEVAFYSVALIIPNIIRTFTPGKVFSGFIMPIYVRKYRELNCEESVFNGLNLISKLNMIFLIPSLVYSVSIYRYLITTFFNANYSNESFYLSVFLFVNVIFQAYLDLCFLSTNIIGRSDLMFKINLLSVSNLVLILLFVGAGTSGIGAANLFSTMLSVMVAGYVIKRIFGMRIKSYILDPHIILYAVFLISFSLLFSSMNIYIYTPMFVLLTFGFIWIIFVSSFFSSSEKFEVQSILPASLRRFL